MRGSRLLLALSLCAAGSAAPAADSPLFHGQNAAPRPFELETGGVTLIVDGSGWLAGDARTPSAVLVVLSVTARS